MVAEGLRVDPVLKRVHGWLCAPETIGANHSVVPPRNEGSTSKAAAGRREDKSTAAVRANLQQKPRWLRKHTDVV